MLVSDGKYVDNFLFGLKEKGKMQLEVKFFVLLSLVSQKKRKDFFFSPAMWPLKLENCL